MKKIIALLLALAPVSASFAQEELTTAAAKSLYKTTSKKHVTVHDPSVVWEPQSKRYYIFGSHRASAYTTDLQNWTVFTSPWKAGSSNNASNDKAFVTPAVKKVKKGGVEVDFPQFNAMEWASRTDADYNINGNMWAPDVIWNPTMQKWCQYLSINGDAWHSSIILLTSSKIEGPYEYQGPVVISGFQDSGHSYKGTDLELVLGEQASLPARYNVGNKWGNRYPNNIDPAAFFDEQGKLWLVYGSWSGGIWMLELDETTGLRDYDVEYKLVGTGDGITTDPYFGKKIAGGYYVSGEGPYIEYIGGYYYLFVSYGFFDSVGGYVMRVFRSKNPNGPYVDAAGKSAVFDKYAMNYGKSADTRGVKLMGAYDKWGFMSQTKAGQGELSQGHNSVIAAPDGRTYLVYHTRFNVGKQSNGDYFEGHEVRVHQLFQTKNGWLVAAPFEYNGETLTDEDIKSRELFTREQIAGTYQLLVHKYDMNYKEQEVVTPVKITLTADGKVTGAYTGTWSTEAGTSYLMLKLGSTTYNGVMIDQQMDGRSIKTVSFSAMATNGVNVWGYKMAPKYELAWQVNNQKVPVTNKQMFSMDADLYGGLDLGLDNVSISWTSSQPDVISDYGKYNPYAIAENTAVTLTAMAQTEGFFWKQEYGVTAMSAANAAPGDGWDEGMVAHYGFDDDQLANTFNAEQQASLKRNGSTAKPIVADGEPLRTEKVLQLAFGGNGKESYAELPNPLYGQTLANGFTISYWVKRADDNLWDALFGFAQGSARFYMTGNSYVGYNSGTGNWIDLNNPNDVTPTHIAVNKWQLVTMTVSRTGGITLYVNGAKKAFSKCKGSAGGKEFTTEKSFDYAELVDFVSSCPTLCLGKGSFWGSPKASFDDVIVYDHPITIAQLNSLKLMENRAYDFRSLTDGIEQVLDVAMPQTTGAIYDLLGRRVERPASGIYIKGGKKYVVR